jgi:hypothetical protein
MGQDELMQQINDDELMQASMSAVVMSYPEGGSTQDRLLDFTSFGTQLSEEDLMPYFDPADPSYDPEQFTHVLMASTGDVPGDGIRMLQFFYLDPDSTNSVVHITNESTTLQYSVDLSSLSKLPVASGPAGLVTVDWTNLTTNAKGLKFVPLRITRASIAHFTQMEVADLEDDFLDLENLTDSLYTAEIAAGTSVALEDLTLQDGTHFKGIDNDGIWTLALFCGACNNPAPWFLTILQPCE